MDGPSTSNKYEITLISVLRCKLFVYVVGRMYNVYVHISCTYGGPISSPYP